MGVERPDAGVERPDAVPDAAARLGSENDPPVRRVGDEMVRDIDFDADDDVGAAYPARSALPDDALVSIVEPRRAIDDAVGLSNDDTASDADFLRVRGTGVDTGSDSSDDMEGDDSISTSSDACMMSSSAVFQSFSPTVIDVFLAASEFCFVVAVVAGLLGLVGLAFPGFFSVKLDVDEVLTRLADVVVLLDVGVTFLSFAG